MRAFAPNCWKAAISSGEQIIAAVPPAGFLDPAIYANLDRFTITFESADYVYLDDGTAVNVVVYTLIEAPCGQTRRVHAIDVRKRHSTDPFGLSKLGRTAGSLTT